LGSSGFSESEGSSVSLVSSDSSDGAGDLLLLGGYSNVCGISYTGVFGIPSKMLSGVSRCSDALGTSSCASVSSCSGTLGVSSGTLVKVSGFFPVLSFLASSLRCSDKVRVSVDVALGLGYGFGWRFLVWEGVLSGLDVLYRFGPQARERAVR